MHKFNLWTKLALGAIFSLWLDWWIAPYFAGTKLLSPVWLTLGSVELYWYGLLMAIAVLLGFALVSKLNQRYVRLNPDAVFYILVATVVGGVIGARLLFVLLAWPLYSQNPVEIWQIHHGGMSIHGAIIGGLIGLWLSARWFKFRPIEIWRLTDLAVLALPLGQAIGRFGNFFNQEAFGGPTSLPWKMFVAPEFRPVGLTQFSYFHPTFLYEALGSLLIAGLIWQLFIKRFASAGTATLWYLILYSGLRFVVEYWRIDSVKGGWLTLAQWGSLAIILIIGIILVLRKYLLKQHHGN